MVSPIRPDHELHRRRMGRNLGLGAVLLAFALLVFGLTVVKVSRHAGDGATASTPPVATDAGVTP